MKIITFPRSLSTSNTSGKEGPRNMDKGQEIVIPPRIERQPTDVLKVIRTMSVFSIQLGNVIIIILYIDIQGLAILHFPVGNTS